jgi:aspartyl-tRNA(Asn)/glutamyl-tRNA(Gln) amidotransferase subunit B
LSDALLENARSSLPEPPAARETRLQHTLGIPAYDAAVLCAARETADYFEQLAALAGDAKAASNWVMTDVLGWLNERQLDIKAFPVPPARLAELIRLTGDGTLSSSLARRVFLRMIDTGEPAPAIVSAEGLAQVRDEDQIAHWVDDVVLAFPDEVARLRSGEEKILAFLMGQIMKRSRGKADPRRATELLRSRVQR